MAKKRYSDHFRQVAVERLRGSGNIVRFGGPGRDRTDDLFHAISHLGLDRNDTVELPVILRGSVDAVRRIFPTPLTVPVRQGAKRSDTGRDGRVATQVATQSPLPQIVSRQGALSCPLWHSGDGGGISIPPHIFFYFSRHAARWRLDAAPVSVRVPVNERNRLWVLKKSRRLAGEWKQKRDKRTHKSLPCSAGSSFSEVCYS